MVSDMYWRLGFGWIVVGLLISSFIATCYFTGIIQIIFAALSLQIAIFAWHRYRHWNGRPWRQVHGRGMLVYSACAGIEKSNSINEDRPFSTVNACHAMAEKLCGYENRLEVSVMVDALQEEQGSFLKSLILGYGHYEIPNASLNTINELAVMAEKVPFSPQLVIANIICNTLGPVEAARYAIALVTDEAK